MKKPHAISKLLKIFAKKNRNNLINIMILSGQYDTCLLFPREILLTSYCRPINSFNHRYFKI